MTVLKPIARSNNIGRRWMKILNQVKPDLASSNVSQNYSNKPNNIASKHRDLKEYSGHCRKSSDKRKGQMEAAIIGVKFDVKPRKSIFP